MGSTLNAISMGGAVNTIVGERHQHNHNKGSIVATIATRGTVNTVVPQGDLLMPLPREVPLMPSCHGGHCENRENCLHCLQQGKLSKPSCGNVVNSIAPWGALLKTIATGGTINAVTPQGKPLTPLPWEVLLMPSHHGGSR